MARPLKMGMVSKKGANRFEWIVSDYFSLRTFHQKLLRSPYFSWGSDAWSFGLLVGSAENHWGFSYVEVSVSNRNGTGVRRLWIRLGIVGRGCEEKETAAGQSNEIGILKIEDWVEVGAMTKIVDDTEGRLVIFCEITEDEEEGQPWCGSLSTPVEDDWSSPADDWSARTVDWKPIPTMDWKYYVPDRGPPTEDGDAPLIDWAEESGVIDCDWSSELPSGFSNVDACGSVLKTKETNSTSPSEEQGKKQKSFEKLLQDLKQLLVSEEQSDVVLKVQGKCFKAHKSILVARCPVFQSMFNHDTKEKETGKVDIADCDPGTFPDFLSYLYTGSADTLDSGNVFSLYVTADKYCVQELREECVELMKGTVTVETFCDVLALALKHDEQGLIETCTLLFTKKMTEIILTEKWQTFICENGAAANDLFVKSLLSKENKNKT